MTANPAISRIITASVERIRQSHTSSERRTVQREHIDSVARAMAELIIAATGATPGLSDENSLEAINNTLLVVVNVAKTAVRQHGLGEPEMTHVECAAIAEHAFKARLTELARATSAGGFA